MEVFMLLRMNALLKIRNKEVKSEHFMVVHWGWMLTLDKWLLDYHRESKS